MPFSGYEFTYDNGRDSAENIQCRLDRALVTTPWMTMFPEAHLWNLDREWSDHSPLKLTLWKTSGVGTLGVKPFRFEQMWTTEEECEGIIKEAWAYGASCETKLEECATQLQKWSGVKFGPTFRELRKKRKQVKKLNGGNLPGAQIEQRKKLLREIDVLVKHEEAYSKQRSRNFWLAEGDRNTKFFHQRATARKQKNTIRSLVDESGVEHSGDEKVREIAVHYFRQMFQSSNPPLIAEAIEHFQARVTADMNNILRADYSVEEVQVALSQMHPIKAPGPDGMCPMFFQTYWHIVGQSVMETVIEILRGAQIPSKLNKTFIALIPKNSKANRMSDFRPISLCNVISKLVSKVLANRLKRFLDKIVVVNQSAFTPGRLITDNILVAFELFHHMKNLQIVEGNMALKLDTSKA